MLSMLDRGLDPDERVGAGKAEWSGWRSKECLRTRKNAMVER
jgi:hypothetical protein